MFEDLPVGDFEDTRFPEHDGSYRFMPYRGPGHHKMQTALRALGSARCYYHVGDKRVYFSIDGCPEHGVIVLSHFEHVGAGGT
jgi:hypothetical protein